MPPSPATYARSLKCMHAKNTRSVALYKYIHLPRYLLVVGLVIRRDHATADSDDVFGLYILN
jgi:hypothetical protein